jgi:hypothetical protein
MPTLDESTSSDPEWTALRDAVNALRSMLSPSPPPDRTTFGYTVQLAMRAVQDALAPYLADCHPLARNAIGLSGPRP